MCMIHKSKTTDNMDINTSSEGNYHKLKDDAEAIMLLIDKYVKVQLIKNTSFTGFLHSIDPISHSIIISIPRDQSYQTVLLPGHAILDVTEMEPFTNVKPPIRKTYILKTQKERKEKVINWLKQNLLPVTEDGDKINVGNASLLPPYTVMDIYTNNPIVSFHVRNILEKMPEHL